MGRFAGSPGDSSLLSFEPFAELVEQAVRRRGVAARVDRLRGGIRWRSGDVIAELRPLCPVTCSLGVRRGPDTSYHEVRFQRRDEAAHVADDLELFLRSGRARG